MGDESKGPRAVAAYLEKHPSYFPNADNRSWIVGRVCFQPSLTWLGICRTCVIFTMSWASSGRGLSDTTFIVMPLPFPCDSVLVILLIQDGSLPPIFLDSLRDFYYCWVFVTSIFLLELHTSIETSISICSLAFGLITRRIAKWTQWVGGCSICTSSRARVETL